MPELSYCAQQIRLHDKDRFLCSLFAPPAAREALFALYALDLELTRIPERVTESLLGQMRYQWWHDTLKEAVEGREPLGHQVVTPVAEAIRAHDLAPDAFRRLVETRMRDLEDRPIADMADFEDYIDGTSGVLTDLALDILGEADAAVRAAARERARGWAIVRVIREIPFHAARGRTFMPLSEIGSGAGDLLAGQGTAAVVATVGTLAEKAAASLEPARGIPKASSSRAKPILLQAVAARRELKRLRRCGLNPFHPKMARPRGGLALSLWLGHLRRKTL